MLMKNLIVMLVTMFLAISVMPLHATNFDENNTTLKNQTMHSSALLAEPGIPVKSDNVSALSKDAFRNHFGSMPDVTWRSTDRFDEATFMKNGKQYTAYFDNYSNLVGVTTVTSFTALPEKGQQNIMEEYENYSIGPVIYFRDHQHAPNRPRLIGTQHKYAENYFVMLANGTDRILVQVNPKGHIYFFRNV